MLEEDVPGEAAFLVEVVEDGGAEGGDVLETSHAPETE